MISPSPAVEAERCLWHPQGDALLVLLAVAHGAALLLWPVAPMIGVGLWWNSNTVSHNFLHRPFFRPRWMNALFSLYLSVLLGIPQSLWRERHLAHHAGISWRPGAGKQSGRGRLLVLETLLVSLLWTALIALSPWFFLTAYLPGYLTGLGLCALHGHYEHARGTSSHYGRTYNLLFFNDGYHVEHHRCPGIHWADLPRRRRPGEPASRWPAVLRWIEGRPLEALERLALRSKVLQRFLIVSHERAFRVLLPRMGSVSTVAIVGGGLFPRTALILRRLLPQARLVIIEASEENIQKARPFLDGGAEFVHAFYDPERHQEFDLVVVPLAFQGDRGAFYRRPGGPPVLVHDWIWRSRGTSRVVSLLLLKRLNLVWPARPGPGSLALRKPFREKAAWGGPAWEGRS